jgi:hypothetical protein
LPNIILLPAFVAGFTRAFLRAQARDGEGACFLNLLRANGREAADHFGANRRLQAVRSAVSACDTAPLDIGKRRQIGATREDMAGEAKGVMLQQAA